LSLTTSSAGIIIRPIAEMSDDENHNDAEDPKEVETIMNRLSRASVSTAANVVSGIVMEGFLVKQGGTFKSWKKRYFTMTHDSIAYMDKENGSVKGGILMEAITSVRDASEHEAGKKEHVFAIVTPARTFIQHADSAAEKESWVTKVKQQVAALEGTATATIPGNANGLPNSDDKLPQITAVLAGDSDAEAKVAAIAAIMAGDAAPFQRECRVFGSTSAKGGAPINTAKTAVCFIEYQNEFATEKGKMYDAVKGVMEDNGMLEKSAAVAAKARECGAKVFHIGIQFKQDHSDNPNGGMGILEACKGAELFTEGTWNAEFCDEMKPEADDVVVLGKRGLDAFPGTELEEKLKEHGIEHVVLGGFLTNCCVESTMRTAYEKGYDVITLSDCTACSSLTAQEAAAGPDGTFGMFSTQKTAEEFTAMLAA